MRVLISLVAALTLTAACTEGPHSPTGPSPTPTAAGAPASVQVLAATGTGDEAGRMIITAKVLDGSQRFVVGQVVEFATSAGTIEPARATTDANGRATTALISTDPATVTATVAGLSGHADVPGTPPAADPFMLSLTIAGASTAADVTFTCGARSLSPTLVPQSAMLEFGDGARSAVTLGASVSHRYGRASSYTAIFTVIDNQGGTHVQRGTLTVSDPPPAPKPPDPPAPAYTVTVTADRAAVVITESATLVAAVGLRNGATVPTSYDWDCNGDGVVDVTTAANTTTCTYTSVGAIKSSVTAKNATTTGTGSTTITVGAAAPLFVAVVPNTVTPVLGASVTFTATVTSSTLVPPGLQWQWDETNDGTYEAFDSGNTPKTYIVLYGTAGAKTLKVRVFDPATGREATGTASVTVS